MEQHATGDQQRRLFAAYVDRMFARRGAVSHYSREQTIRWPSWLARGMQRQGHMEYFAALPDTQRPVPLTNVDIPHCGAEKLKGGRPKKAV